MYQQITIVGNCGRDPEMRYTSQGVGVCSFSVAANTGFGENKKTVWFRVSAWRNLAEVCSQYVSKGMLVMVTGEVEVNAYMSNDGQPRASMDINARDVKFLSRRDDGDGQEFDERQEVPQTGTDIPF